MFLIVQEILVDWSKDSRGGNAATLRNRVPAALPLMNVPASDSLDTLIHYHAAFRSGKSHKPDISVKADSLLQGPWLEFGCTHVQVDESQAVIRYSYTPDCVGAPRRYDAPREVIIKVDQWARVVFNGRFSASWEGYWYYRKRIFNIGLFTQVVRSAFLNTPLSTVSDLKIMW